MVDQSVATPFPNTDFSDTAPETVDEQIALPIFGNFQHFHKKHYMKEMFGLPNLIRKRIGDNKRFTFILFVLLNTILFGTLIIFAKNSDSGTTLQFLHEERRFFEIYGVIINIPLIWTVYFWQSRAIFESLSSFKTKPVDGEEIVDFKQEYLNALHQRKYLSSLIKFGPALGFFGYMALLSISDVATYEGFTTYWWQVNGYFTIAYGFLTAIPIWILFSLVWHHLIFCLILIKNLKNDQISIQYNKPDTGFTQVKKYFKGVGWLVVSLGFFIALMTALPLATEIVDLFSNEQSSSWNIILFGIPILIYALMIGIALIIPLQAFHKDITQTKAREKEEHAEELEKTIDKQLEQLTHEGRNQAKIEYQEHKINALKEKIAIIENYEITWPFAPIQLIRWIPMYTLPLVPIVLEIISIMLELQSN